MVRVVVKVPASPLETALACFDGIVDGRQAWEFDLDEALALRSVYAYLAEEGRLGQEALAQLAAIDAFWRAHPQAFDAAFAYEHAMPARERLAGFATDEEGNPAVPPPSHWWWRPSGQW
ncbi:hypothetical protein [Tepidimonas taiwanensis]|uniref:hypothetical protein n=1 Tax=Tepidimonas taiwanensis TaxID=307486 RepID=UPI0012DFF36C|nr:hypothetical protein [Tepidimonas taiwanensis]